MSLQESVEQHYVEAIQERDRAETAKDGIKRLYWQGAIEVLEEIMHEVRPGWSWETCQQHGLIASTETYEEAMQRMEGGEDT